MTVQPAHAPQPACVLALRFDKVLGFALGLPSCVLSGDTYEQQRRNRRLPLPELLALMLDEWFDRVPFDQITVANATPNRRLRKPPPAQQRTRELADTVARWCEARAVRFELTNPHLIQKFWTGNGKASKGLMVVEAGRRGFRPAAHEEAFALAAFHMAMAA